MIVTYTSGTDVWIFTDQNFSNSNDNITIKEIITLEDLALIKNSAYEVAYKRYQDFLSVSPEDKIILSQQQNPHDVKLAESLRNCFETMDPETPVTARWFISGVGLTEKLMYNFRPRKNLNNILQHHETRYIREWQAASIEMMESGSYKLDYFDLCFTLSSIKDIKPDLLSRIYHIVLRYIGFGSPAVWHQVLMRIGSHPEATDDIRWEMLCSDNRLVRNAAYVRFLIRGDAPVYF